jgi:hypothetical protein
LAVCGAGRSEKGGSVGSGDLGLLGLDLSGLSLGSLKVSSDVSLGLLSCESLLLLLLGGPLGLSKCVVDVCVPCGHLLVLRSHGGSGGRVFESWGGHCGCSSGDGNGSAGVVCGADIIFFWFTDEVVFVLNNSIAHSVGAALVFVLFCDIFKVDECDEFGTADRFFDARSRVGAFAPFIELTAESVGLGLEETELMGGDGTGTALGVDKCDR